MRTLVAFLLRLILFMPLAAAAHLLGALSEFLRRLSDGLFDMASATRQITRAPYVRRYDDLIREAEEERRLALLRKIRDSVQ